MPYLKYIKGVKYLEYLAEYENGYSLIIVAKTDGDALDEAWEEEEEQGTLIALNEINENDEEIRTIL